MTYNVIRTGSDGNCTILDGIIAVDMGIPYREIKPYEKKLKLVLLTHQHGDHFKRGTVCMLAGVRPSLRWACCHWLVPFLLDAGVKKPQIDVLVPDQWYEYKGIGYINPFETMHNVQNCGWRYCNTSREYALYATDLGAMDGIEAKNYDLYLLEANHKEAEIDARAAAKLEAGEFAYETAAAENHLSYEQAIEWLHANMGTKSLWIPMHGHKERTEAKDGKSDHKGESENIQGRK